MILFYFFFIDGKPSSPLHALSKLVPVPESLMSPDYRPTIPIGKVNIVPKPVVTNNRHVNSTNVVKSPKLARSNMPRLRPSVNSDYKRNSSSPITQRRTYTSE